MATTDAALDAHGGEAHDHDDHHDHPSYLAHHFDTPEQQFDSGKLGMWLFLVTEVLFFSGMFCAYAIFRSLRPEVFVGCSEFLNTKLGAINTGVLLFSSLTAAWAVRCSQTENNKGLVMCLAATLSCAMIFLGVKSIEYSHKWEMGLLPAGMFNYTPDNHNAAYLFWLCFPFGLMLVGTVIWLIVSFVRKNEFQLRCALPLSVVAACFFVGVGLGMVLESGGHESAHGGDHDAVAAGDHSEGTHGDGGHSGDAAAGGLAIASEADGTDQAIGTLRMLAGDETNTGIRSEVMAREQQKKLAAGAIEDDPDAVEGGIVSTEQSVLTPSRAGVFFSIYYCMTGVHAIHILAGIGVLVWLLIRAVRMDFNHNYFGPVDYVALYWHIVDLIWIYLFPLLYLIR